MSINDVKQQICAVINALDRVSVCGYQNLCNLQGSIDVLKAIVTSDFGGEENKEHED